MLIELETTKLRSAFRTIAEANRVGAQVLLKRLRVHLNEHQDGIS